MGTTEDTALNDRLERIKTLTGTEKRAALLELAQDLASDSNSSASRCEPLFEPKNNLFDFEQTELVRLDKLPAPLDWREHAHCAGYGIVEPDAGFGLGSYLNAMLGGGIGRGEIAIVGAAGPGSGKTHIIGQLGEGLALRNAQLMNDCDRWAPITRTLTPVLWLSELMPKSLLSRGVARWTGLDGNVFRQGRHWEGYVTRRGKSERIDFRKAQQLANETVAPGGALAALSEWTLCMTINSASTPRDVIEEVRRRISALVAKLSDRGLPSGLAIVPCVFVDPIQRYQGDEDEIRGLNALIEGLSDAAKADGFAVLCSSDTNKDSTTGGAGKRATNEREARERGAKVLRGSNKLLHLADTSLYIDRDWDAELPRGFGEFELAINKNRNGAQSPPFARFRWHFETGRMFACTEGYCKAAVLDKAKAASGSKPNRAACDVPTVTDSDFGR